MLLAELVQASDAVRATLAKHSFPDGVEYRIAYDPTIFVRASIRNVIKTLFEALVLDLQVMLDELQLRPEHPYLSLRLQTPEGYTPNDASLGSSSSTWPAATPASRCASSIAT